MNTEQERAELLPCPFCGAGKTEIQANGRPWLGTRWGEPASVSVRHWCEPVDGQPSRMIERVGRDRAAAIDAWNRRAALQSQDREDAERLEWLVENMGRVDIDEGHRGWFVLERDTTNYLVEDCKTFREAIDDARRAREGG